MADQENMAHSSGDEDMECAVVDSDESEEDEGEKPAPDVYLPNKPMEEDEELVMDESAYVMYHQAQTGAPCLSFDVIPDGLGERREAFPLTCYLVAGSQAERSHTNNVIVMKMANLQRNKAAEKPEAEDDEDSDDTDEEEDEDDKPVLQTAMIRHNGCVNRIRCAQLGERSVAATWAETGKVHVWDLTRPLHAVNDSKLAGEYAQGGGESAAPLFTFSGHQVEGFALDWCPVTAGRLASGDCKKNIHVWNPAEGGSWHVDQRPFTGHTASVEDIQWSPNEANVFASCSVDKSVRIWDARASPGKACMLTAAEAHDRDVNVISWNRSEPFIISGGDDGLIKVWDLRQFQSGQPVALFKQHTQPITSVEWSPVDSTVFAASGSDDQLTVWDLAVERDQAEVGGEEPDVPPQLLFIHQGQTDIKELHWHRQLPGVILSTAHSGFNVFRTISV